MAKPMAIIKAITLVNAFVMPLGQIQVMASTMLMAYFMMKNTKKDRLGLEYVYDSKGENKWFDDVRVSYDKQDITLRSQLTNTHCSTYPHIDKKLYA